MKYQGVVTEQDWKEGVPKSPVKCAFARAIQRQFPGKFVIVSNLSHKKKRSDTFDVLVYSSVPSSIEPNPDGTCYLRKPGVKWDDANVQEEKSLRELKGTLSSSATILADAFDSGLSDRPDYPFEYDLETWSKA